MRSKAVPILLFILMASNFLSSAQILGWNPLLGGNDFGEHAALRGESFMHSFFCNDGVKFLSFIKHRDITWFLTNFCVESTARTAYDRGYAVTVVKDATAANSAEDQNYTEEKIFPLLGQTLTVGQFLSQLQA